MDNKESNKTFEKNFIFNNKKIISPKISLKDKLISKRKIFPVLKNEKLHKSQTYFESINKKSKTNRSNLESNEKINLNNLNESEKFFDIFRPINKNFFKGENFSEKYKMIKFHNNEVNTLNIK